MPRRGGKRVKRRTHVEEQQTGGTGPKVPKSFIIRRGRVELAVKTLVQDLRLNMSPNTALKLRERRKNTLKDFVSLAGPLGVSHMMAFNQSGQNLNLRFCRLPKGPTVTFRVQSYTLTKDVRTLQRRPVELKTIFQSPPMLVLNNFQTEAKHLKVVTAMFQTMFPTIDVDTFKISACRRVVLVNYNKEEDLIEWRHYAIRATPVGVSRGVKKVIRSQIPNLGRLEDISEFVLKPGASGYASDSEAEDESTQVTLPANYAGKGNTAANRSAVRLHEIGPRMDLSLVKIEQEIGAGDVLYHKLGMKDPAEAAELKRKRLAKEELKKKRREEQNENVKRKQEAAKTKKAGKAERRQKRDEEEKKEVDMEEEEENEEEGGSDEDDEVEYDEESSEEERGMNSDEEWYEREVGESMPGKRRRVG